MNSKNTTLSIPIGEKYQQVNKFSEPLLENQSHQFIKELYAENESPKDFEKKLYLFRKTLERKIAEIDFLNIHINSCSSKTVVYKGLFTAKQTEFLLGPKKSSL